MDTQSRSATTWNSIPYTTDKGIGWRAHIGMVVISNDQTLSYEARAILTIPGIALYESRLPTTRKPNEPVSERNLLDQAESLAASVQQINTLRSSDVIALGCTSAAMLIGPEELRRRIGRTESETRLTDPFTALKAALKAVQAQKVAYVSPYPETISERMVAAIGQMGIDVPTALTYQNESGVIGDEAPFISATSVKDSVRKAAAAADVDTVVVACTQMRVAELIAELELETGKTVLSSNQALCWHALRLTGYDEPLEGWGKLFER